MILFLQFTITDTRHFSDHYRSLLDKPFWPSPRPYKEFVRNTGRIIERNKGGQAGWVGENYICNIKNSIKFDKYISAIGVKISNISKHLYASEHYILTKFEFVFNIKIIDQKIMINHFFMKLIINEIMVSKIKIKINGYETIVQINQMQNILRDFHFQNTTKSSSLKDASNRIHIFTCTPQLYFYLEKNEISHKLESNYKHIANIYNIAELYGAWYDHKNNPFRIWIHRRLSKSSKIVQNRELRMTIMRLHSEYECLKNIFNAISNGILLPTSRSRESEELQRYFNNAIRTFLHSKNDLEYKSWTLGFFDYFSKIFSKAAPGELENVRKKIEHFRPNIKNKTIYFFQNNRYMSNKFINTNSTILSQGDGNTIQNNQILQNNNDTPDIDYPQLLIELNKIIEVAQKHAKTTDDFKSLTTLSEMRDATEKKDPNKLINTLKKTGKFVANLASEFTANILSDLIKKYTTGN